MDMYPIITWTHMSARNCQEISSDQDLIPQIRAIPAGSSDRAILDIVVNIDLRALFLTEVNVGQVDVC